MTTIQKMMKRTGVLFAATLLALVMFSGVALAATISCEEGVECFGTTEADTLNGSEGIDAMFGKGRGDTIKGFGNPDYLYGQGGADKLFGGSGVDYLTGGPRNDEISGGEDLDFYHFGDGWGKDSITDGATSQNQVVFRQGPTKEENVPVTDDLIIKLFSGDGPEVKNASATSTINWEANAIAHVTSGSGDDLITGNVSANSISANVGGADNISTGAGDDRINVADGVGDDTVDCGESFTPEDNDTVFFDSGDQIADNCETKHGPA
jgi:hypothetical protein